MYVPSIVDYIPDIQLDMYFRQLEAEDEAVFGHMQIMERESLYFGQFSGEQLTPVEIDPADAWDDLQRVWERKWE